MSPSTSNPLRCRDGAGLVRAAGRNTGPWLPVKPHLPAVSAVAVSVVVAMMMFVSAGTASAAPFTPGNLVVTRVGTGAAPLGTDTVRVFIDEYTTGGSLVQSIALPFSGTGAAVLTLPGNNSQHGRLMLSADGAYLMLAGYNTQAGSIGVTTSLSTVVQRTVGRIDMAGAYSSTLLGTTAFSGSLVRAAASPDGNSIYVSGAGTTGGVHHTTFGSGTALQISTTITDTRGLTIAGGSLFAVNQIAANPRVGQVGTGFPVTAGQTIAGLPGFPTTGNADSVVLLDLDAGVAGLDTAYLTLEDVGVQKFSLVAGVWTSNGIVDPGTARGIAVSVAGNSVNIVVVEGVTPATRVMALTDATGWNGAFGGTFVELFGDPANTGFRGVAFVPVPEPATVAVGAALVLLAVGARMMRRGK